MASNPQSKFSPFNLTFEDDITTTGIKYIPKTLSASTTGPSAPRPLIVCIHGGTCSAHNFDVRPGGQTISTPAEMASVPVISINRPGYCDSTALQIREGSTYHQTLGWFHHHQLLPRLWREFGELNHCTGIVVLAHSLGAPGVIVSSALHAEDPNPGYPLAGFIFSGWGSRNASNMPHPPKPSEKFTWKRRIMLGPPELDCAPPAARKALEMQDQPAHPGELDEIRNGQWKQYWRDYSDRINVPIMWAIAEYDQFFEGSHEHLEEYKACFQDCPRFDANLLLATPHAVEWSYMAAGWYMRCLGFATEACVWLEKRKQN